MYLPTHIKHTVNTLCIFQQRWDLKFTSYFDSSSAQSLSLFGNVTRGEGGPKPKMTKSDFGAGVKISIL